MLTAAKKALETPANIEEVEYPPEVVERLEKLRIITEAKIAMGEKLNMVRAYAAKRGIKIDD
ncbi:MAG: hypothetical protein LBB74_06425 [Chitinispirillales bacterium]|jgi:hypothetical protein|nr:hypothetical protein [Chitinispirillales bacterium]